VVRENEERVQDISVIIIEFTDNKSMALKPASCEAKHEVDSLGGWEREGAFRSLPIPNPLALNQRSIKTTVCKIPRYVSPQVAQFIPNAYCGGRHANDTTVVLRERADGMDEALGVWMCPGTDIEHRQCLPDSRTQENTAATSRPDTDV
jgi:hypothetical protein